MAVFILKAKHGICYTPPPCTGVFPDVPCTSDFAPWIEQLAAEGITGGCGGGNYCPRTRAAGPDGRVHAEGQVRLGTTRRRRARESSPTCPALGPFADWIEQLAAEEITAGCGGGNYCPIANVARGQMAVFLVKTFGLQ